MYSPNQFSQWPQGVDIHIIRILQVRRLRHREFTPQHKVTQWVSGRGWIQKQAAGLPSLCSQSPHHSGSQVDHKYLWNELINRRCPLEPIILDYCRNVLSLDIIKYIRAEAVAPPMWVINTPQCQVGFAYHGSCYLYFILDRAVWLNGPFFFFFFKTRGLWEIFCFPWEPGYVFTSSFIKWVINFPSNLLIAQEV